MKLLAIVCPHCGSEVPSQVRRPAGQLPRFRCGACGGLSELSPRLLHATLGVVSLTPAFLLVPIRARDRVSDSTSWLAWAVMLTLAALLVYQLFALRRPFRKVETNRAS